MDKVQKTKHAALLQSLHVHGQAAEIRGAGGPESNGFLLYPSEPLTSIEDVDWSVALRQRLHLLSSE